MKDTGGEYGPVVAQVNATPAGDPQQGHRVTRRSTEPEESASIQCLRWITDDRQDVHKAADAHDYFCRVNVVAEQGPDSPPETERVGVQRAAVRAASFAGADELATAAT